MNIFKKLFSKRKNKKFKNVPQVNEEKNLNGNFSNQSVENNQSHQKDLSVENNLSYQKDLSDKKPFAPADDSFIPKHQNVNYEWIAKQQYENSIKNGKKTYTPNINSPNYYDSQHFPFEDKYTQKSGDIFFKNKNESRLKKEANFSSTRDFINDETKADSIFKSDKLYTLDELKVFKIPLTKTVKVFDKGSVFFKMKESIDLTPQEANVYVFKHPYDISEILSDSFASDLNQLQAQTNPFNYGNQYFGGVDNIVSGNNHLFEPKLLYRISNVSFQNENGILSNVSFDIWCSEIVAILSLDNSSNYLLTNVLKGLYKFNQGSIYFNNSVLYDNNNKQDELINLTNDFNNQNAKINLLKNISQINYLNLCGDQNIKVGTAFEIICNYFGVELNRNLFGNLLQLTNFLKLTEVRVKDLQGIDLEKFNVISDFLIGKKIIYIESLFADLDFESKQNLLAFLHSHIVYTSTACLLVTNNIQDAAMFADRFIVIKGGVVAANFTKFDVDPNQNSLENYLANVIYNNQNPIF